MPSLAPVSSRTLAARPGALASRAARANAAPLLARPTARVSRATRGSGAALRVQAVLDVTSENWESEVLQSDVPVLVDFWAEWCGPCKLMAPMMDKVQAAYGDSIRVVKCETDSSPELVEKYNVYGLPTLMLIRNGEAVEGSQKEGATPMPAIEAYLKKYGIAKQA